MTDDQNINPVQNNSSSDNGQQPVSAGTGSANINPSTDDTSGANSQSQPGDQSASDIPASPFDNRILDESKLQKFEIPPQIKEKYPDIINLVISTESMNDEERQYWFQILPIMTIDQIVKFKKILVTEKEQLSKLDQEYEQELNKLNEKHLLEWQEFESKEKRKKLQEEEGKIQAQENQTEQDLLNKLNEV